MHGTRTIRTIALVALPFLLIIGFSLVLAQQLVQPDGRLNQIAHFGGDAFYCVDDNRNPTNQFSDHGATGFRLLNKDGQELWYVSPEVLESVLPQVVRGAPAVPIAKGNGTYGETALYVEILLDGRRFFTFMGYDEHGKSNSLTFEDCNPVGSAVLMDTPSPSPSPTLMITLTPGGPTETATLIPSETNTPGGPTETASATATNTVTPTDTFTPTNTVTPTDTFTPTNTVTSTDTFTPTNTVTPTDTFTPTNTVTPTDTFTPTNTQTPA